MTSINIHESVASIGDEAFSGCSGLTSINIPYSVTSIGNLAFSGCSGLTSINISEGAPSIGDWAFSGCSKLIEVINKSYLNIIVGSSSYGSVAYYAKQVIKDESQSNIIKQDYYIFYNDNENYHLLGYTGNEKDLVLPAGINGNPYSIYNYAFSGCSSLTSIIIPDSVTSIGSFAFENCDKLTIYAKADSEPEGWKPSYCPVVWGYTEN